MPTTKTETLEAVAEWHSAVAGAAFDRVRDEVENQLSGALRHLLAMADQRPELLASGEFQALAQTIENIESSLRGARRRYNATVRDYNRRIRIFPGNLLALLLKLRPKPLLDLPAGEEMTQSVSRISAAAGAERLSIGIGDNVLPQPSLAVAFQGVDADCTGVTRATAGSRSA